MMTVIFAAFWKNIFPVFCIGKGLEKFSKKTLTSAGRKGIIKRVRGTLAISQSKKGKSYVQGKHSTQND